MAYTIHKSDGTVITVEDNSLDQTYYVGSLPPGIGVGSLLVGRNTVDYGAAIAQNFLQMTENFASVTGTFPSDTTALQGQLWFDKTNEALFVRTTSLNSGGITNWKKLVTVNSTPPAIPTDGDILVAGSVISIYAGGTWNQIFPAVYS